MVGAVAMKITMNVDCKPEEARAFLGLPDEKPMQEKLLNELEERLRENLHAMDPEAILKMWLSVFKDLEELQEKFLSRMTQAAGAKSE